MKKLADILEARYVGPITPETVDEVHELYRTHQKDLGNPKTYARKRYQKTTDNQWDVYAAPGKAYAELVFRPDRVHGASVFGPPPAFMMTQDELTEYVKDYIRHHQIPYTSIDTRGTNSVSVKFEEPDKRLREAVYKGSRPAIEVEELYQEVFRRYTVPDDNMELPNLKWKGVNIVVWAIDKQGSEKGNNMAAFVSFKFEGEIAKEEAIAWTENFAKKKNVPYTTIEYSYGQRSWEEMDVPETSYTAILYEE